MKSAAPCRLLLVAFVAFTLPAKSHVFAAEEAAPKKDDKADERTAERPEIVLVRDSALAEVEAYRVRVVQLFNGRDFGGLETIADEARSKRVLFATGAWKITRFYEALEPMEEKPESVWLLHEGIHRAWLEAQPDSIAAHVSNANFLTSYAWRARGGGYAETVAEEGWKLFGQRLEEAQKVLSKARDLPVKCPMWWAVQMTVALGAGWPREKYDALFAEAKRFDPEFWIYDVRRAQYLLPRWYGEPGEWEATAEKEIEEPGLGIEAYARVVCEMGDFHKNIFRDSKASWVKTQEGFRKLREKFPNTEVFINRLARLACWAKDVKVARACFEEIGTHPQTGEWKDKEHFIRYRNWAYYDQPAQQL